MTADSPLSVTAVASGGQRRSVQLRGDRRGAAVGPGGSIRRAGLISGVPTVPGSYGFTVTATASGGDTGQQAYSGVVNSAIAVAPTILPALTVNSSLSVTAMASGGSGGPYSLTVTAGALPSGLTLDPITGLLSGTPLNPGPYRFTVTATASGGDIGNWVFSGVVDLAPMVSNLQRFGFHAQRTVLVLSFNTALDPARAQDLSNYTLFSLGKNARRPRPRLRPVRLASALYDPVHLTVTLTPAGADPEAASALPTADQRDRAVGIVQPFGGGSGWPGPG